jgi:hypothetical protein
MRHDFVYKNKFTKLIVTEQIQLHNLNMNIYCDRNNFGTLFMFISCLEQCKYNFYQILTSQRYFHIKKS